MEGFWSLLRFWLRPHRGLSQAKLPLYLSFFEFVHNVRKRGKGLLFSLLAVLPQNPYRTIFICPPDVTSANAARLR
jgi:transposase